MTWQQETVESTDTYKEFLTSMVAVATSRHVSAAAVNAGGTGYVVGDVLTITHGSAYHDCTLEVTAVSSGVITAVRINNGGAFAERLASATVNAGGSGYAVGDILEVQDGTGSSTEKAKVQVATLSGSAVATVTVFETGGAYTTTPTTTAAATLGVGPAAYAGDDACTLNLTMQSIIGTTGISATGGTGSGATFDLTLTATGWSALYNKNEATSDSVTDQKEVVLIGTVSSGDAPIVGFLSYRQDSGGQKRYGIACFGMLAFNPALALNTQPGIGPLAWTLGSTSGSHILITEEVAEGNIWGISVTGRRIYGFIRGNIATETDNYHTFYCGLGNGLGTATTRPYPLVIAASSNVANRRTSDTEHTGLSECFQSPSGGGPVYYLRPTDLVWTSVVNGVTPSSENNDEIMWPRGIMGEAASEHLLVEDDNYKLLSDGTIGSNIRANVSGKIYPTPGSTNIYTLLPLTIISNGGSGTPNINTTVFAELDGCFFTGGVNSSGTAFTPEDQLEQGSSRYILVPCNNQSLSSRPYQFMALRQN